MTHVTPATRTPRRLLRVVLLLLVVAVEMLITDLVMSYVVVFSAFGGGPLVLAIGVVVAIAALAAAIAIGSRSAVGRAHIVGAICVTVLLAGIGGYGLFAGTLPPLPFGDSTPLHLAVCALCALSFGLFTGPWPLRLIGAAAAVAAVALVSVAPSSAERAADQARQAGTDRISLARQAYLDRGSYPMVTDLAGWRAAQVQVSGSNVSQLLSDSGAVATVVASGPADAYLPSGALLACSELGRDYAVPTPGADGLSPWCVVRSNGWARIDGTGVVFVQDDVYIILTSATEDVVQSVGTSPATSKDIAALADALRPMTREEVQTSVLPAFTVDGSDVVDLP